MSLTTDVIDLLDALGDTEEQVAATLAEKGIKGLRREQHCCPVFNYLSAAGIQVLYVGDETIGLTADWSLSTPSAISEFIHIFDEGGWPELIESDGGES